MGESGVAESLKRTEDLEARELRDAAIFERYKRRVEERRKAERRAFWKKVFSSVFGTWSR